MKSPNPSLCSGLRDIMHWNIIPISQSFPSGRIGLPSTSSASREGVRVPGKRSTRRINQDNMAEAGIKPVPADQNVLTLRIPRLYPQCLRYPKYLGAKTG